MFCVGFVIGKVSVWRISLRCKCKSLQAFLIFRHLLVTYVCLVHIVVFKSCLPDIAPKRKEYGTKKGFEEKVVVPQISWKSLQPANMWDISGPTSSLASSDPKQR